MPHQIKRINKYEDLRFSEQILFEHGAFIIDDKYRCSFKIIGKEKALIEFDNEINIEEVIDEFRLYSEQITKFYDKNNKLIKEFPNVDIFEVIVQDIQPSQFYVDENKVRAVSSFITSNKHIIVPLIIINGQLVSVDGHSRLYLAVKNGYEKVYGFYTQSESYIEDFVLEAKKRNILTPNDLSILSHPDYDEKWIGFCNKYFEKYK